MYPSTYFGLFPAFPRDDRAFVAMSFSPCFEARWQNVIAPAVRHVRCSDVCLQPHRVDLRSASDSILTEILDGIGRCRVFVADITSVGDCAGRPVRNANVMYEVGIAHAVRLPEEVVLLRSDDRPLDFDVTNVRVHGYDPDGSPEQAQRFVSETIIASLREADLRRAFAVRQAAGSLTYACWMALFEAHGKGTITEPPMETFGQLVGNTERRNAIAKLLEVGAVRTDLMRVTPDALAQVQEGPAQQLVTYCITPFGSAVVGYGVDEMGLLSDEMRPLLERMTRESGQAGEVCT